MTSNGPYNIPTISSKSKAFSYRDIISTGGCPPSAMGASEFQAISNYNSIANEAEPAVGYPACPPAPWSEFFVPVSFSQPLFEDDYQSVQQTMSRQTLGAMPIDSIGMPPGTDEVNDLESDSVFHLSTDSSDDLCMWAPSSPVAGLGSRAALISSPPPPLRLPPPQSTPTAGVAEADAAAASQLRAGGVDAAQDAADALVEFVRQHPELRGSLWSRLRTGFEGCL